MTKANYEGVVDSIAVPVRDLADKKPYFVFSMSNPSVRPPNSPSGTAVFYVDLEGAYGRDIMSVVKTAYELGVAVQVGETKMIVTWVQLPRRGLKNKK